MDYSVRVFTDYRPGVRQECDDGYAASGEILLVARSCVSRQHHVETFELRGGEQIAVCQLAPTRLIGELHRMVGQKTRRGSRNINVKQDS